MVTLATCNEVQSPSTKCNHPYLNPGRQTFSDVPSQYPDLLYKQEKISLFRAQPASHLSAGPVSAALDNWGEVQLQHVSLFRPATSSVGVTVSYYQTAPEMKITDQLFILFRFHS